MKPSYHISEVTSFGTLANMAKTATNINSCHFIVFNSEKKFRKISTLYSRSILLTLTDKCTYIYINMEYRGDRAYI